MTRLLLCSFASLQLLVSAMSANAQDGPRRFKPMWEPGDARTTNTTRQEQELKNGVVEEDTSYSTGSRLEVMGMDADSYALEVRYSNVALQAVASFYDGLGEELQEYQDLVLEYSVDKKTGAAELQNWKEAKAFMDRSFKAISKVLKEKDPESADFVEIVLAPLKTVFESKENIEAYIESEIGYLFFPFGKTFTLGDTLRIEETAANPFNPEDSVSQTTLAWLADTDGPGGRCEIHSTVILDLTAFKELMKAMKRKMGSSIDVADSALTRKDKEIDELEFDMTNGTVITLDEATTWPIKVVQEKRVVGSDPKGRREKSVRATTVLN
ncbi:MAG: hypothetical protein IPK99_00420 [Flavobacteriales bacterium]|nr:hypothetical protein [Flavobacteriales bacterium]